MKERAIVYAGAGSRKAPREVLRLAERVAARLAELGLVLRTGGAEGMDEAWERGARSRGGKVELYLPWNGFRGKKGVLPLPQAYPIAAPFHPKWGELGKGTRALMARNAHVVLGEDLATPAAFLLVWTPGGEAVGGTGHAIRLAASRGVPVFNLARKGALERLGAYLERLGVPVKGRG